ncbi:ABC transporter permease [Chloroflexota bacterium]
MKNLRHIWYIALKDLKLFVKDKLALFFFVAFPFLFIILFNFLLADVGSQDDRLALHLHTSEAEGSISYQIIDLLETKGDPEELDPGVPQIIWIKDKDFETASLEVEDKTLSGFLSFPPDFTQKINDFKAAILAEGDPVLDITLDVVVNPEESDQKAALNGLASGIASQMNSMQTTVKSTAALLREQLIDPTAAINGLFNDLYSGQWATGLPTISYQSEQFGEVEAENAANYVIPGYLVMFTFFAALQGGAQIVQQRQNNTLERMFTSSVSKEAILGGTFLGIFLRGFLQIAIFWTLGALAFNIDLGIAPAAVILISVLMVFMSSACAIMLATLIKTERAADGIATLTALILAPLGGCWWPLFITPKWMQFIAKITPHAWANNGFNKLMVFGADFGSVVTEMLALVGFAVAFGLIAIWRFRVGAAR